MSHELEIPGFILSAVVIQSMLDRMWLRCDAAAVFILILSLCLAGSTHITAMKLCLHIFTEHNTGHFRHFCSDGDDKVLCQLPNLLWYICAIKYFPWSINSCELYNSEHPVFCLSHRTEHFFKKELTVAQLIKKFQTLWICKCTSVFKRVQQWSITPWDW